MNNRTASIRRAAQSRKGQSIIEALVSLSVLMTGLMGVLALLSQSFFLERVTTDQSRAAYLAAEGIEIAKNLIDHNVYLGISSGGEPVWGGPCFNFAAGSAGAPTHQDYELDYGTTDCSSLPGYAGDYLRFDVSTGLYGYAATGGSSVTAFKRLIRIIKPSDSEIDVQSTVTWSTGLVTNQSLTLEDHFYNWHP